MVGRVHELGIFSLLLMWGLSPKNPVVTGRKEVEHLVPEPAESG